MHSPASSDGIAVCHPNQVLQLFRRLKNPFTGDDPVELRNQILLAQQNLVRCLAAKYANNAHQRSEFESEGNIGLLEAIERFDPTHGVPFGAYAVHFVRARICRRMYADRDLRFGGRVAARLAKVRRAVSDDGRPAELICDHDLAASAGLPLGSVRRLRPFIQQLESLDHQIVAGAVSERVEAADEDSRRTPAAFAEGSDDLAILERACDVLSEREHQIIRWAFGFEGQALTSVDIAALIGVSRQRVDQIKERALQKLKEAGWSDASDDFRRRRQEQRSPPSGRLVGAAA